MSRIVRTLCCAAAVVGLSAAPVPAVAADLPVVRDRAVRWAQTQVGQREVGTSNCSPRIDRWERDMGLRLPPCRPWCGAFVHQAFLRAGLRLSARLIDPDRSYGDAVAGRRGLRAIAIADVHRGDLLFFSFRPGPRASHIALVTARLGSGKVRTVEGNISHTVTRKTRGLAYPVLAARVTGRAR